MSNLVSYIRVSTAQQRQVRPPDRSPAPGSRPAFAKASGAGSRRRVRRGRDAARNRRRDRAAPAAQCRTRQSPPGKVRRRCREARSPLPRSSISSPRLMVHRVPFIVAQLGADVDPFMIHLFAALAGKERAPDLAAHEGRAELRRGPRSEAWQSRISQRPVKPGARGPQGQRRPPCGERPADHRRDPEERRNDVASHRRCPQCSRYPDAPWPQVGSHERQERAGEGLTPSFRGLAFFAVFAVFLTVPGQPARQSRIAPVFSFPAVFLTSPGPPNRWTLAAQVRATERRESP